MEENDQKLFKSIKRATILSGIGMGLLLGIIMGLSVSEVVKVIMGAMTAILGAFLGFDKQSFTGIGNEEYQKIEENRLFTALRAGWFGLAVLVGIISGMYIRTHEVFTPTVSANVKQWTDAGYSEDYARKLVAYQRLGINPSTGAVGPITDAGKILQSNLFSTEQVRSLCNDLDTDPYNKNWADYKKHLLSLNISVISSLTTVIEQNVTDNEQRFSIINKLNTVICNMKTQKDTQLCKLGTDLDAWKKNELTASLAQELMTLNPDQQKAVVNTLSGLFCELEKR
ncbi:hypothetical protein KXQ82_17770 [Mucilaginibacter sp. HMF5004]|uniref:hypothetical protein n=1 Tax=Mucilaginibacter rivuli TaxID=2857527 RepID=UPI001C5F3C92|nr:hypothetical protein [Mucilaginibacter rivuli]MBW4891579.1 hypothetical protein [Mucilaginibacter rivuli]